MSKFSKVKISDIGQTITGKTPSSNAPEDFGSEYMFVTPSDSFDKKMMNRTERYLSAVGVDKLSNKLLPPKSIMVTCIGSAMGKVAMNETSCITNQQINSIIPNKLYDSDYIYYVIKNNYKVLRNAATGSTALPLLNKTDFDILELPIYKDKAYQQKISSVLSPIDTKIELNNQINAELEVMAKTLYDYWFVQFDFPNEQGKPYKSSGGKMVYNKELKREIPEGWEVKTFGDYSTVKSGFAFKSTWWQERGIPVVKIKDIQEDYTLNQSDFSFVSADKVSLAKKFISKAGDIVIAMTGATIGKFAMIPYMDKTLLVNQRVGLYDLGSEPFEKIAFLINSMKQDFFRNKVYQIAGGAAQPNISGEQLDSFPLINPANDLIKIFNKNCKSTYKKIANNIKQNQQLASLRDWLLPMLMNGQVTVKEAEKLSNLDMAAEPEVEYNKNWRNLQ
jgi:type I restriction enzyme S subunit